MSASQPQHALTLQAPWWAHVLYSGKDVENRGQAVATQVRERLAVAPDGVLPVYITASARHRVATSPTTHKVVSFTHRDGTPREGLQLDLQVEWFLRAPVALQRQNIAWHARAGRVVGVVDIVGVLDPAENTGLWSRAGDYGLQLANPRPLTTPIACKGGLGLWRVIRCCCGIVRAPGAAHADCEAESCAATGICNGACMGA